MADKQAGIELILSAPNVKGILDDVIDSYKEINELEKKQKELAEEVAMAHALTVGKNKQIIEQNKIWLETLSKIKQPVDANTAAILNQHKVIVGTTDAIKDQAQEIDNVTDLQKKSIFAAIRDYIAQRRELKNVKNAIVDVRNEILALEAKQRELGRSATLSADKYKEFEDGKKRLEQLNTELKTLTKDHKTLDLNIKQTERNYGGLMKVLGALKKAAVFTLTAIGLVATGAAAAILKLTTKNDVVEAQFKKTKAAFAKATHELTNAFAPVLFVAGKLIEDLAKKLTAFLENNSDKLFEFAAKSAGFLAGVFGFVEQGIKNTAVAFRKLGAEADLMIARIKLAAAIGSGNVEGIANAAADVGVATAALRKINKEFQNSVSPTEAATEAYTKWHDIVVKMGKAAFDTANLTDEQLAAIKKLRDEYKKLTEDIKKQLQELDIQEAGPFEGILLKADISIAGIKEVGDRAVELAIKLGESNAKINEIKANIARLAKGVRDDAASFLLKEADDILASVNKRLEELNAKKAGTEDELKFARELDTQFKEFQKAKAALEPLINRGRAEIEKAKKENREANAEIVQAGLEAVRKLDAALFAFSQISQETKFDFLKGQSEEFLKKVEEDAQKQFEAVKLQGEKLRENLEKTDPVFADQRKEITIDIKANDLEFAVAVEKLRQIKESLRIFKETGVPGEIETDAVIRIKVEQTLGEIQKVTSGDTDINEKKKPAIDLVDGLEAAVEIYALAFQTIDEIVLASIDTQLEAIDRLVEKRNEAIDDLEKNVEFEATLKAANLANDFEVEKKKLEQERNLRDQDLQKQEELQKKRAKIQQQLNTAQQASALATAVANTFRGWSEIPFVGQVLAIASIAAMFASFIAAKSQAAKLARAYKGSRRVGETFGTLAPGEGEDDRRHDRGLSVVDSHGRLRGFIGGDEAVMKESVSRKHRVALAYLNENEGLFNGVNLLDRLKGKTANNPRINYERISNKIEKYREKVIVINANQSKGITKEDLKEAVREVMKEHANTLINYHESRPDYVSSEVMKDGYVVNAKSIKRKKAK